MAKTYVTDLQDQGEVNSVFALTKKQVLTTKKGDPYLNVVLQDRTGSIKAKMWSYIGCQADWDCLQENSLVQVQGKVQSYQNALQITLQEITVFTGEHSPDDFIAAVDEDVEKLWTEMKNSIESIKKPHLKKLLQAFFSDDAFVNQYKTAPAAKSMHDNKIGGLLKHSLQLVKIAKSLFPLYKDLNLEEDLIITAAILHDVGKTEELDWSNVAIDYTDEGRFIGHINIAIMWIKKKIDQIKDFPKEEENHLLHLIISHHGELEFGANKLPATKEAFFLHGIDKLDSALIGFTQYETGESDWVYSRPLNRWLFTRTTENAKSEMQGVVEKVVDEPVKEEIRGKKEEKKDDEKARLF